jgi:hypothetical protein
MSTVPAALCMMPLEGSGRNAHLVNMLSTRCTLLWAGPNFLLPNGAFAGAFGAREFRFMMKERP